MKTVPENVIRRLVDVTEVLAMDECEATKHGQEPCPLQYDDDEEWCLICLAKKAYQQFFDSQ